MHTQSDLTRLFLLSELAEKLCRTAFEHVHLEKEIPQPEDFFASQDEFIKMLQNHVTIDFQRIYNYVCDLYLEYLTQHHSK